MSLEHFESLAIRQSNESRNESRRSSLASSIASRAKGRATMFGRRKTKPEEIAPGNVAAAPTDHFFSLPSELQVEMLSYLPVQDVLSCRLASRFLNRIICTNESDIVRQCLRYQLPRICKQLYPEIKEARAYTLFELYNMQRRVVLSNKLATQLIDFVELEIMRRNTAAKREIFKWDRIRLFRRFAPLCFVIYHFFEKWRIRLKVKRQLDLSTTRQDRIQERYDEQQKLATSYDPHLLKEANDMYYFLLNSVMRILRPPTYATGVEKAFKGWHPPSFTKRDVCHLLAIGGIGKLTEILAQNGLSARAKAMMTFGRAVSCPHHLSKEERLWPKSTPGTAMTTGVQESSSEVTAAIPYDQPPYHPSMVSHGIWDEIVPGVLTDYGLRLQAGPYSKGTKAFLSDHLGYDIVAALKKTDGSSTWRPDARGSIVSLHEEVPEGNEARWVEISLWRAEAAAAKLEASGVIPQVEAQQF
ncbi:MAG: hypothetical protein M1828_003850 [Chrysothrix sp. TS-e1954]|nr:MAG: hypothetical protein M1828_003850 [Chrysothrix sp. TS-e1954]